LLDENIPALLKLWAKMGVRNFDTYVEAFLAQNLPYLLPYYGTVHMTDLRGSYFDEKEAGGTFRELVAYHGIDDIYVVLSTSNGINSANSLEVFHKTISK